MCLYIGDNSCLVELSIKLTLLLIVNKNLERNPYKVYRWISFGILCFLFEPACHYLLDNYTDLIRATEVCIYIAAEGVMMAKAIFMFYNHKLIQSVLEDLQLMANERIRIGRFSFLLKLDREAELICKRFLAMLAVAICIWSGGPVAAILYRTFTKTYVPHIRTSIPVFCSPDVLPNSPSARIVNFRILRAKLPLKAPVGK